MTIPESVIRDVFSQAFVDANDGEGLIIVNNDGPLVYSIVFELTAKARRIAGMSPR